MVSSDAFSRSFQVSKMRVLSTECASAKSFRVFGRGSAMATTLHFVGSAIAYALYAYVCSSEI